MPIYIYNTQKDEKGFHEVHVSNCYYLPAREHRVEVGVYPNCQVAIQSLEEANAGKNFKFNGCFYCSTPCHHG